MRAEKNKFGRVGKSAYLCIRFHKEIVEALYLRLANGNLRNFHCKANNGRRAERLPRLGVGLCLHFHLFGFSQDLHFGTGKGSPALLSCSDVNAKLKIEKDEKEMYLNVNAGAFNGGTCTAEVRQV